SVYVVVCVHARRGGNLRRHAAQDSSPRAAGSADWHHLRGGGGGGHFVAERHGGGQRRVAPHAHRRRFAREPERRSADLRGLFCHWRCAFCFPQKIPGDFV